MEKSLTEKLELLAQTDISQTLQPILRGVEKESLRVTGGGKLAQTSHPKGLGSALVNSAITTDFSESLLEFVTPAVSSIDEALAILTDIHKFTLSQMPQNEVLWAQSMPCEVAEQEQIPIAQYGESNIGKMKTLYRKGLSLRYGSMMQAIAGVHYNFSMPQAFWQEWQKIQGKTDVAAQDFQSASYMGLVRNYYRNAWIIPFLFGASPAISKSFLQGKSPALPFKNVGEHTLYLPYATSLRLSDLGYTNAAQKTCAVSHNSLEGYIKGLQCSVSTPSVEYQKLGVKDKNGEFLQLNTNILQIENELYSAIRPKRVPQNGETPIQAMRRGGVQYVEVRALDVNPFSPIGIDKQTAAFIDVFLCWCLLCDSPETSDEQRKIEQQNFIKVVLEGRKPNLMLQKNGAEISLNEWGVAIIRALEPIAKLLDMGQKISHYTQALQFQMRKINHPDITPSGQVIEKLLSAKYEINTEALKQSTQFKQLLQMLPYQKHNQEYWQQKAVDSLVKQQEIEAENSQEFGEFLADFFAKNQQPF